MTKKRRSDARAACAPAVAMLLAACAAPGTPDPLAGLIGQPAARLTQLLGPPAREPADAGEPVMVWRLRGQVLVPGRRDPPSPQVSVSNGQVSVTAGAGRLALPRLEPRTCEITATLGPAPEHRVRTLHAAGADCAALLPARPAPARPR